MASGDIWILGIHMTKFGKYPDKDIVDLAAEAAMAALADGGVTMKDIGVLAAGNLMMASPASASSCRSRSARPASPSTTWPTPARPGRPHCAPRSWRSRRASATWAWPSAWRSCPERACSPATARPPSATAWTPAGRYGAVTGLDGRVGTETMPGVFAQVGMEYGHRYGGTSFELFARIAEKNHAHSTLNPLATYTKRMTLEEIMNDVMISYPNTRSMCSANCDGAAAAVVVSDARLRTLGPDQRRRAVKVAASVLTTDPWQEACQVLPDINTLTRNAAAQAYEQAGVGPPGPRPRRTARLLRHRRARPLRQPHALPEQGGAADFFESGATWRDGSMPVNVSGGLESKGHPIAATGIANIWEVCHHLRGEAGDRQIEGREGRTRPRDRTRPGLRPAHPGEGRRGLAAEPLVELRQVDKQHARIGRRSRAEFGGESSAAVTGEASHRPRDAL